MKTIKYKRYENMIEGIHKVGKGRTYELRGQKECVPTTLLVAHDGQEPVQSKRLLFEHGWTRVQLLVQGTRAVSTLGPACHAGLSPRVTRR